MCLEFIIKFINTNLDALVSLVSDAQLLSNLVIVSSDSCKLLLNLSLAAGQVDVDYGQLIDAGHRLLIRLLDGALGAKGLDESQFFYKKLLAVFEINWIVPIDKSMLASVHF